MTTPVKIADDKIELAGFADMFLKLETMVTGGGPPRTFLIVFTILLLCYFLWKLMDFIICNNAGDGKGSSQNNVKNMKFAMYFFAASFFLPWAYVICPYLKDANSVDSNLEKVSAYLSSASSLEDLQTFSIYFAAAIVFIFSLILTVLICGQFVAPMLFILPTSITCVFYVHNQNTSSLAALILVIIASAVISYSFGKYFEKLLSDISHAVKSILYSIFIIIPVAIVFSLIFSVCIIFIMPYLVAFKTSWILPVFGLFMFLWTINNLSYLFKVYVASVVTMRQNSEQRVFITSIKKMLCSFPIICYLSSVPTVMDIIIHLLGKLKELISTKEDSSLVIKALFKSLNAVLTGLEWIFKFLACSIQFHFESVLSFIGIYGPEAYYNGDMDKYLNENIFTVKNMLSGVSWKIVQEIPTTLFVLIVMIVDHGYNTVKTDDNFWNIVFNFCRNSFSDLISILKITPENFNVKHVAIIGGIFLIYIIVHALATCFVSKKIQEDIILKNKSNSQPTTVTPTENKDQDDEQNQRRSPRGRRKATPNKEEDQ